ncbi:MAG: diguanylate cyclase [Rhodocyclaceae bacterium]|nr:diguanylate cyclase [Rhodocyclaceae bacterium]
MKGLDRLTIHRRLLVAGLLPTAIVALGISAWFLWSASREFDRSLEERGLAVVGFLAPASEYGLISGNRETLDALLQAALTQRQVHAAAVIQEDGRPLAISGAMKAPEAGPLKAIEAPTQISPSGGKLRFIAPVWRTPLDLGELYEPDRSAARERIGWVYAELDTAELAYRKWRILALNIAFSLLALAATGLFSQRLARTMSRPLERLASAVGDMARGIRGTRVAASSGGEIGELEHGFNHMAEALEIARDEMQSRVDAATEQLRYLADHDPLSGLANRRAFEREVEAVLGVASPRGHALCFMDLDRFKIVNDTCGHVAGDELLRQIGTLLQQHVRDQDMLARVGGDEFALLLRDCGLAHARAVADSLCATVAAFRFPWEGREFRVGASIGLVLLDEAHHDLAHALSAADRACYAAKRRGRNQVCEAALDDAGRSGDTALAPPSLAAALEQSRLRLQVRPILPVAPEAREWAEVVLHIDLPGHPDAQRFIERCERDGDGLALDLWTLNACCQVLRELAPDRRTGLRISIALGDASICGASDLITHVEAALQRAALSPDLFGFEITADRAAQYPGEVQALVRRIRHLGAHVILADYRDHALSLLRSLRPDYVKVSLEGLSRDYEPAHAAAVATSVAGVATALGAGLVVVGMADGLPPDLAAMAGFVQGGEDAGERDFATWLRDAVARQGDSGRRQA